MHTGCPVLSGVKWTATKWIHTAPFHPEWLSVNGTTEAPVLPEDCMVRGHDKHLFTPALSEMPCL